MTMKKHKALAKIDSNDNDNNFIIAQNYYINYYHYAYYLKKIMKSCFPNHKFSFFFSRKL